MSIAQIKSKGTMAKKPSRYPDGVYTGTCLSVATGKDDEGNAKFVLTYSFRPQDGALPDVPFDLPHAKYEFTERAVFEALFGERGPNGLTGGYHRWSGKPNATPAGDVELTIEGRDGGKKRDGSGYWDPSYKILDISPLGSAGEEMESAMDAILSTALDGEKAGPEQASPHEEVKSAGRKKR